jgi:seryl-tRNA synthetase
MAIPNDPLYLQGGARMIDINLIREKPDLVRQSMQLRQMDASPVDQILSLDEQRRARIQEVENLKAQRNTVSKEIGRMADAAQRQAKIDEMRAVGDQISQLDEALRGLEDQFNELLAFIPNIPDPRTPVGKDEDENVVVFTSGEIPQYGFEPQPHWDLGPALGIIDFEQGVKITGSRFYVLNGAGARLQRALDLLDVRSA